MNDPPSGIFEDQSLTHQGCNQSLVAKPVGNRPPGRLTSRWEDNTKMDLK